jgi:hypothetical protein
LVLCILGFTVLRNQPVGEIIKRAGICPGGSEKVKQKRKSFPERDTINSNLVSKCLQDF